MESTYLWAKAFHIVFVVSWFSGLFYLPRIFVNLAMIDSGPTRTSTAAERDRLLLMARKLVRFMGPLALFAMALGLWLWLGVGIGKTTVGSPSAAWLHAKLFVVVLIIAYHRACELILRKFEIGENKRSHVWYRWFNEVPVLLLVAAVILVVVKPF
jgi:protoporphyrinogen IX oxidase